MSMTNQETDTALILENELQRRVSEVTRGIVEKEIRKEVRRLFLEQKDSMLMEVSVALGKMLSVIEKEGRKPLWEATPEEFGLTKEDLNHHNIEKVERDALREQTSPL